jgi:hypothetical protein
VAPVESDLSNATVLAGVLPHVDAIIQTLDYNATDEIITFSASMDAGARPTLPFNLNVTRTHRQSRTKLNPDCDS